MRLSQNQMQASGSRQAPQEWAGLRQKGPSALSKLGPCMVSLLLLVKSQPQLGFGQGLGWRAAIKTYKGCAG